MSLLQANYEEVMLHLRHAFDSMQRFMETSTDWTARVQVEEEFRNLRDTCREFARCQYGIEPPLKGNARTSASVTEVEKRNCLVAKVLR